MSLEAIRYSNGKLEILDQLLLPLESKYIPVNDTKDGWDVIRKMQVNMDYMIMLMIHVCGVGQVR